MMFNDLIKPIYNNTIYIFRNVLNPPQWIVWFWLIIKILDQPFWIAHRDPFAIEPPKSHTLRLAIKT